MTSPMRFLVPMGLFLCALLVGVVLRFDQLLQAFASNPALNGLICGVLLLGIVWSFWQVCKLRPEVRWLSQLRQPREGMAVPPAPRMLAPMAGMLTAQKARTGRLVLSQQSANTLLDSLASRLEEGRQISRYMAQLLIFLGLLGTFYGLILTVQAIAGVINNMNLGTNDLLTMFDTVKSGLVHPLTGMATAFSASMFGLAGALILGFLDLLAGQAQNRFFNELEEWLAGHTQHETPVELERELAASAAKGAALGAEIGAERNARTSSTTIMVEDISVSSSSEKSTIALNEALALWLPRVQDFMRLTTDNMILLQQNMNVLRTLAKDGKENHRQSHDAMRALVNAIEKLDREDAATTQLLQQIERQLAGLRNDWHHERKHDRHEHPHHEEHRDEPRSDSFPSRER